MRTIWSKWTRFLGCAIIAFLPCQLSAVKVGLSTCYRWCSGLSMFVRSRPLHMTYDGVLCRRNPKLSSKMNFRAQILANSNIFVTRLVLGSTRCCRVSIVQLDGRRLLLHVRFCDRTAYKESRQCHLKRATGLHGIIAKLLGLYLNALHKQTKTEVSQIGRAHV